MQPKAHAAPSINCLIGVLQFSQAFFISLKYVRRVQTNERADEHLSD